MTETADLIPVRALNQVSYCQRLYYLEYVESLMPINEHVEDGTFLHRRVDDPELQNRTRKNGDTLQTRSVQIASETLGITGNSTSSKKKTATSIPSNTSAATAPPRLPKSPRLRKSRHSPTTKTMPSSFAPRHSSSKKTAASRHFAKRLELPRLSMA